MIATTIQPRIDWLNIGRRYTEGRETAILAAIEAADLGAHAHAGFDEWLEIPKGGAPLNLPFAQGEAIKSTIKEFTLPRVSHVLMLHSLLIENRFGIYGIRAHYGPHQKQHRVELFVMDDGVSLTPLLARVWPKPE